MHVFELDQRELTAFGSHGAQMSSLSGGSGRHHVTIAHLESGGLIGMHSAPAAQTLGVVIGEVVVRCGAEEVTLRPGSAVRFDVGADHETSALADSVLIVVETRP